MMGRNDTPQKPLFYAFNLDELVPQDHLLRKIDTFLDLSDLHEHLAPDHSTFSKNRHGRFRAAEVLRHVFERVLQSCIDAGLVGRRQGH